MREEERVPNAKKSFYVHSWHRHSSSTLRQSMYTVSCTGLKLRLVTVHDQSICYVTRLAALKIQCMPSRCFGVIRISPSLAIGGDFLMLEDRKERV